MTRDNLEITDAEFLGRKQKNIVRIFVEIFKN